MHSDGVQSLVLRFLYRLVGSAQIMSGYPRLVSSAYKQPGNGHIDRYIYNVLSHSIRYTTFTLYDCSFGQWFT